MPRLRGLRDRPRSGRPLARRAMASNSAGFVEIGRDTAGNGRDAGIARGAQTTSVTLRSRDSFQAIACSRAPPPITRIFMRFAAPAVTR